MGFVGDTLDSVRSMQVRNVLSQVISLGRVLTCEIEGRGVLNLLPPASSPPLALCKGWDFCNSLMFLLAGMIVTSALIIWKGLIVVTGSESPVVVVLSGSMEPGFKRVSYLLARIGNELICFCYGLMNYLTICFTGRYPFLHMSKDPIRTGEIVVFNIDGREIPIVHRVIKVHERQDTAEVDIPHKRYVLSLAAVPADGCPGLAGS
ncbi:hypothetical protein HU200_011609 [Digitaria exilis]|uniref:Signal peptidase complex catalytic subunit SEC11 n=1 Tax=Digitaria exilis TaxID=1010633 RepID=A0A835FG13_9POAL|nr:hypothetical protein HU200_011609 [Digitaria exilis]